MELDLQAFLGLLTGLGLSAACGFRVFVPMLVAAIAVRSGAVQVSADFAWIASTPAIVCFGAATAFEIAGYYLPGVDHFLDVIATPAAIVAGTLLTASFVTDMAPWLRWSVALIAPGCSLNRSPGARTNCAFTCASWVTLSWAAICTPMTRHWAWRRA